MRQQQPAPEPAEIAGRYQIIHKLGAGAFGTVYKARDKTLGRTLAIKTIRLEGLAAAGASLEEMLERFKREAQVSAQLKHPNIVTIYDIGDADGLSYLAMEFIDGVGLERVIAGAGRLPVERAAFIGAQVADALDFAHRHNVVHRDVKPANIMIETGDRVKVTDFGIAKVIDSGEHLTMAGSLLGTPSYMSPEQARGSTLDGRSDLFSVGCVLYEMVTGKKAFRGQPITALLFKIITEEPVPLQQELPDAPEELTRIIAKALAKGPDTRYQSGKDLAEDLLLLTRGAVMPSLQVGTATARVPPSFGAPNSAAAPPTQAVPLTEVATGAEPVSTDRPPADAFGRQVAVPTPPARSLSSRRSAWVSGLALASVTVIGGIAWLSMPRQRTATPPNRAADATTPPHAGSSVNEGMTAKPKGEAEAAPPLEVVAKKVEALQRPSLSFALASLNDEDPAVRAAAAKALGRLGPSAPGEVALRTGERVPVKRFLELDGRYAIFERPNGDAFAVLRDQIIAPPLEKLAAGSPVRPAVLSALLASLRDVDTAVRISACQAIGGLGKDAGEATAALRRVEAEDSDVRVRAAAREARLRTEGRR